MIHGGDSLLILLLSLSSASANLGDTKDEAIKAYGQSIGSDKGLTTYRADVVRGAIEACRLEAR
jgi:hypothetical protein